MAQHAISGGHERNDRRTVFVRVFWGLAGLLGALIGIPVAGAFLSPALRTREKSQWVAVGPVSSLGPDPRIAHHLHPQNEGWVNVTAQMQVWVVREGGSFKIFDNHCTHLGCAYHWEAGTQRFVCPCHNGQFDISGKVVSGPPPRPLDYYDAKVDAGLLYMGPLHRGGTYG